jgi:hypothetical protein
VYKRAFWAPGPTILTIFVFALVQRRKSLKTLGLAPELWYFKGVKVRGSWEDEVEGPLSKSQDPGPDTYASLMNRLTMQKCETWHPCESINHNATIRRVAPMWARVPPMGACLAREPRHL